MAAEVIVKTMGMKAANCVLTGAKPAQPRPSLQRVATPVQRLSEPTRPTSSLMFLLIWVFVFGSILVMHFELP